jgi:hypothetical protein
MKNVKFRVSSFLDVVDLNLAPNYEALFTEHRTGDVVSFRAPTQTERDTYKTSSALCTAVGVRTPEVSIISTLESLASLRIPPNVQDIKLWKDFVEGPIPLGERVVDPEVRLDPNTVLRHDLLPDPVCKFIVKAEGELTSYANRAAKLLRWRLNLGGSHELLQRKLLSQWSFDNGESWIPLPIDFRISISSLAPRTLDSDEVDFLQTAIDANLTEPLAHEILQEATSLCQKNPRSSLIMAVLAAEVGIKQFVISAAPQTEWLVENLQSPPIVKIAVELIPVLAKMNIPEPIIDDLKTAVNLRNAMIHRGVANLKQDRLSKSIRAVGLLLNWLDANRGEVWARKYLADVSS